MKEIIVHPQPSLNTELHDVPIPSAGPNEVVIKVEAAGSNVKDWVHLKARNVSANSGDDVAGTIHTLGSDVVSSAEFHVGDRVAAFHVMLAPGGAYAEYAVTPQHTVMKLPEKTGFEEAATMPLICATAGLALFLWQALPPPWSPRIDSAPPLPLIVYGASSALGSFAIKLAKAANIHPIIAIGGGSQEYISKFLDSARGDTMIDYRQGVEAMKAAVKRALGPLEAHHAFDCISSKGTWIPLSQMLASGGVVSVVSGSNKYDDDGISVGVEIKYTYVGAAHSGAYLPTMPKQPGREEAAKAPEVAYVLFRYMARMFEKGTLEGHPYEVVPGGLDGVETGLKKLQAGEAKGKKFIYRISETKEIRSA